MFLLDDPAAIIERNLSSASNCACVSVEHRIGITERQLERAAGHKLAIVQGGYNDLANGVPHDQTVADLRGILANLRGRHIKTVLCGFFYKQWDGIGRKLAATYHATFVPGSTCYDPRHRGPDGTPYVRGGAPGCRRTISPGFATCRLLSV